MLRYENSSYLPCLAPTNLVSKRKINEKKKELKHVTKYLRRLDWCRVTGEPYDPNEQYSIHPRALCDNNGVVQKVHGYKN